MGVTREDFIRSGRYLEIPDAEWEVELATRKQVVGNYMANDAWGVNIKKNVGVLLTSSCYGRPYLKGSVESHKKLGYWLVISYDNFIDPLAGDSIDFNYWLPPKDVMVNIDTFLIPHHQFRFLDMGAPSAGKYFSNSGKRSIRALRVLQLSTAPRSLLCAA